MTKSSATNDSSQLYLLSALVKDETALEKISELVSQHNCVVKKTENLGTKQLHFPVNGHNNLLLVSVFFTSIAGQIPQLEQELSREDHVERFLITTWRGDLEKAPRAARNKPQIEEKSK